MGKFHKQGDTKWIVIMVKLRGHNDMPFGQPTPGRRGGERDDGPVTVPTPRIRIRIL
jgi:hypothetical protein